MFKIKLKQHLYPTTITRL